MNVSLPASMKAWVDEQVVEGGYGTASEYIRQLLREERIRRIREEINANLRRAIDSGEPIPVTPEYWEEIRRETRRRLAARRKSGAARKRV